MNDRRINVNASRRIYKQVGDCDFAFVEFFAAFRSFELRVAAIAGSAIFLTGTALDHAYQIALTHNMAPGNAGIMFYSDIVLPIIGCVLLGLQWRVRRPGRVGG